MDATIFAWTLAATVAAGFHVFVSKVVASKGLDSALSGVFNYGIPGILSLCLFLYTQEVPDAWLIVLAWAALDGALYCIGSIARIDSLRYIDATIYFPINKIVGPLFVVIAGVSLLSEHITLLQWVGVFLALCIPLLLIERAEHARQKNLYKGLMLCIGSTLLTGATVIVIKYGLAHEGSFWLFMTAAQLFAALFSALIYAQKHAFTSSVFTLTRHDVSVGSTVGILSFISGGAFFAALQYGHASLVYTIHSHYILIPIFLSVWWYGEHINARKFAAVVLSCITLTLLY